MLKNFACLKLAIQKLLLKHSIDMTYYGNNLLENTPEFINKILNSVEKEKFPFLFLYSRQIHKILREIEKIINITDEHIDVKEHYSLFYICYLINYEKEIINYSYEDDFINNIYEMLKNEPQKDHNRFKLFLSYIMLQILVINYKSLDNYEESEKLKEIEDEIEDHQNKFNNELKDYILDEDSTMQNIEDIYSKTFMFLIKNKKIEDYEYSINILEQMDMKNIELSNKMFEEIKNIFETESNKDYFEDFKITKYQDLINPKLINFYFILFAYILKQSIYIYYIPFLNENRTSVINILKNDYYNIISHEFNKEEKDLKNRQKFILKRFLDSEYLINLYQVLSKLCEVSKFFSNYKPKAREKEINQIKEIISHRIKDKYDNYDSYYEEAQKMNKKYGILRHIYNYQYKEFNEEIFENKVIKPWMSTYENYIHKKKKPDKIKIKKEVFTYFKEEKNREELLRIFKEDEIDYFVNYCNTYDDLNSILYYFKNIFFESKKKEIVEIEEIMKSKELKNSEKYMKYLEIAKKMNLKYALIKNIFIFENNKNKEEEIQLKLKELNIIEKNLEEENLDAINDEIQIKLIKFFTNNKNNEAYKDIISTKCHESINKISINAIEEILEYNNFFSPEITNEEIDLMHNGGELRNDIISKYLYIKKINLRRNLITSLLENEKENGDYKALNEAKNRWEKIENYLINKQYDNIEIKDRDKLINIFNEKKEENYKIIKQIFNDEIIDEFIKYYNQKKQEELNQKEKEKEKEKEIAKEKEKAASQKLINNNEDNINSSRIQTDFKRTRKGKYRKNKASQLSNIRNNNDKSVDVTQEKTPIRVEQKEVLETFKDMNDYITKKIFEHIFSMLLYVENKNEENIITVNNKMLLDFNKYMTEEEFNQAKENLSNDEEKGPIFEFIDDFKERIKDEYTNNFKLKIELTIQKNYKEYFCIYTFYPPDCSKIKQFQEQNISINKCSTAFDLLIKEINDEYYTIKKQKDTIPEKKEEISLTTELTKIESEREFYILKFIKIIGNHNESEKYYTAEFIKELSNKDKDRCKFISGGTDQRLKIYTYDYDENKDIEIKNDIKDWTFSIVERKDAGENLEFIACANKEVLRVVLEDVFDFFKYEMPNMICVSSLEMKALKENNNIKEIKDMLIIAGRGVLCLYNIFRKETQHNDVRHMYIIKDKSYRGIAQLTETQIVLTSNEIIPGGENKLIIYNIFKDKMEKEIEDFSFTATTNALYVIKKENDDSKVLLLCGCKKYKQNDKNGILIIELTNELNDEKDYGKYKTIMKDIKEPIFYETEDFEVYCFCRIKLRWENGTIGINNKNNDIKDWLKITNYLFVGGYDNQSYEGKIKLFKLVEKEGNKRLQFLQDVEICDNLNGDKDFKFNGFGGAISSIIQTNDHGDILASCYDGKVYLFTPPNLSLYEAN